jgi:hypothetical protein
MRVHGGAMANRSRMLDWRTWLRTARETARKGAAYARGVDADDPVTMLWIWVAWLFFAGLCWWFALANPWWVTLILVGFVIPLGVLYLVMRSTRGSEAEAMAKEREEYLSRHWIDDTSDMPKRVRYSLQQGELVMYACREHPISLVLSLDKWQLIGFGVAAIGLLSLVASQAPLGLVAIILGLVPIAIAVWDWSRSKIYFTNLRIFRISGIFTIKKSMMHRDRIQNVYSEASAFSNALSKLRVIKRPFAPVMLETAAQDERTLGTLEYMGKPTLVELLTQREAVSMPGDQPNDGI